MTDIIVPKDECFKDKANAKKISLRRRAGMKFTRQWFVHRNQSTYSTYLAPKFGNSQPWNMIQIGVFEGMDLIWQLDNCLGHKDSRAVALDPWLDTGKLDQSTMDAVAQRARGNIAAHPGGEKVFIRRGLSQEIMDGSPLNGVAPGQFDYIIIDGDHRRLGALADAKNSFDYVKPGGWLLFDDVHNRVKKKDHVADAIREWYAEYKNDVKLAWAFGYMHCFEKLK